MAESQNTRDVHRFAIATACATILLLVAGALVTGNDAADSVPDWPLAYGKIIPPLIGGIRYEFAHRVAAALVAILTVTLAIWIARTSLPTQARRWSWTALALVLAQAGLGGLRVKLGHPALIATAHATLAQIYFLTLVGLTILTSNWWQADLDQVDDTGSPRLRTLSLWTTAAILVQLVLGAAFRHGAFGILPHLAGAVVVLFLPTWATRTVRIRFGQVADLRRWAILLQALLGTQILLGFAAYWAVAESLKAMQPVPLYVVIQVAHVVLGALTLAASVLLSLASWRLIRPSAAVVVESSTQKAGA